ncbi:MAG: trypsin-like peptidase domain-containing protein, partial [Roseibium sp.]
MTRKAILLFTAYALGLCLGVTPAASQPFLDGALASVVSVLPVWPGKAQGGGGTPPGAAPEGSGVVVGENGLVATAFHVIEPAERIDVRLADGRILPADLIGHDEASDIALLKVPENLPLLETALHPSLASRACVISNAYGLGLSVTCGVVSARHVSNAGFNAVEDFIQTDAAANPGSS